MCITCPLAILRLNTPSNSFELTVLTSRIRGGRPRRAMAVDSFLLFPPEYFAAGLSAYSISPSLSRVQSTTWLTCKWGSGEGTRQT